MRMSLKKNADTQGYDPAKDVNAYPVLGGDGAYAFNVYDTYVDIISNDTYVDRFYAVSGIDNEKRVITLDYLGEKTDTTDTRTEPAVVPADKSSMEISTPIFDDVPSTSSYALALASLKRNGSIQGYDDGTYKPDSLINRAEFTKIMMGNATQSLKIYDCSVKIFSDVSTSEDTWYRDPVCHAFNEGIIAGYSDGTFKPEQNINYAEAAKIIVNAFNSAPNETTDPWYLQFINVFDSINGKPSTVESPDQKITRGEMGLMMYNFMDHALELQ